MDVLMNQTVVFVFLLALSLLIERLLEVLKSIYDYVDFRLGWDKVWTKKAATLQKKIDENISALEKGHHEQIGSVVRQYAEKLLGSSDNGIITVSGDLYRATTVKFVAKLIAMVIGVALALGFNLDVITLWHHAWADALVNNDKTPAFVEVLQNKEIPVCYAQIATGVVLGLGSAPLHKIITSIERQQKKSSAKQQGGKNV